MNRAESKAHDRGYQDGYDEARAEFLWKVWKRLQTDTVEVIAAWVLERADKAATSGRWPEGFDRPGVD